MHTGCPWADLSDRFGKSNSVCHWFRRLAEKSMWDRLFEALKHRSLIGDA